jgi:hypothetical protein
MKIKNEDPLILRFPLREVDAEGVKSVELTSACRKRTFDKPISNGILNRKEGNMTVRERDEGLSLSVQIKTMLGRMRWDGCFYLYTSPFYVVRALRDRSVRKKFLCVAGHLAHS